MFENGVETSNPLGGLGAIKSQQSKFFDIG
jgi:hypothetical protein